MTDIIADDATASTSGMSRTAPSTTELFCVVTDDSGYYKSGSSGRDVSDISTDLPPSSRDSFTDSNTDSSADSSTASANARLIRGGERNRHRGIADSLSSGSSVELEVVSGSKINVSVDVHVETESTSETTV